MKPIFIGGCERSGTTLLAALLAGHSRVIAPPEAQFFLEGLTASRRSGGTDIAEFAVFVQGDWRFRLWELPHALPVELAGTFSRPAEVMARLANAYAERTGKEGVNLWVDHMPMNIGYAPTLLAEFHAAKMIHIVRDPRAVVASVLPLDWGPPSARLGARWWLSRIAMGLAAESAFPDRVVRVHYEDLVRDPAGSLERLCPLLGLMFEPTMIAAGQAGLPAYTQRQHALVGQPPNLTRIDAWRSTLSERDIAVLETELRDIPAILGYDSVPSVSVVAERSSAREFLGTALQTARQRWRHSARLRRGLKRSEHASTAGASRSQR